MFVLLLTQLHSKRQRMVLGFPWLGNTRGTKANQLPAPPQPTHHIGRSTVSQERHIIFRFFYFNIYGTEQQQTDSLFFGLNIFPPFYNLFNWYPHHFQRHFLEVPERKQATKENPGWNIPLPRLVPLLPFSTGWSFLLLRHPDHLSSVHLSEDTSFWVTNCQKGNIHTFTAGLRPPSMW